MIKRTKYQKTNKIDMGWSIIIILLLWFVLSLGICVTINKREIPNISSYIAIFSLIGMIGIYYLTATLMRKLNEEERRKGVKEREIRGKEKQIHCWLARFLTDVGSEGYKTPENYREVIREGIKECGSLQKARDVSKYNSNYIIVERQDIFDRKNTYDISSDNFWNILDFIYEREPLKTTFDNKLREWSDNSVDCERLREMDRDVRGYFSLPAPSEKNVEYP